MKRIAACYVYTREDSMRPSKYFKKEGGRNGKDR
jgi:hypothetical protein